MKAMITHQYKYQAFIGFAYNLKFLDLVGVGEAVRLTGGVYDVVDDFKE